MQHFKMMMLTGIFLLSVLGVEADTIFQPREAWPETMTASREAFQMAVFKNDEERENALTNLWNQINRNFPLECDWALQDAENGTLHAWFSGQAPQVEEMKMIEKALGGLENKRLNQRMKTLRERQEPASAQALLAFYLQVCSERRNLRFSRVAEILPRQFVYAQHRPLGGSHYAYTEAQSDAQAERTWLPGSALCLKEIYWDAKSKKWQEKTETLLEDKEGMIRDPDVSYDGKRILFAWKKSLDKDDFHLYEMDAKTHDIRQLTFGLGYADYEGAYLPSGDIVFNSSRCVQTVDCWWTEVSNLYTCDRDGKYLRRLSYDQVHTNYPVVLEDGRVIYTRWDYNDRGQIYPQPLFQMNPDGTGQTEFYGNNSFFPTTILHARGIPGTKKVMAVASGHHSRQTGKLIVIDPSRGRQENSGVTLIAPVRETPAERIDSYGQNGDLFQYPYPLTENVFLVTYAPLGWDDTIRSWSKRKDARAHFSVYLMTSDAEREILAHDPDISCGQSVALVPRKKPHLRPSMVNYASETGTYYMQDIYAGAALKGIERGTVKRLRVVGIEFRAAGVGSNSNGGEAGGALVSTPIAIDNGTWDVKRLLGEATVYEDGSAFFEVPARTPLYFQAIDEKGYCVATMRSWSTLQPGENFSCVGCHEPKDGAPLSIGKANEATRKGVEKLREFHGPARAFSYPGEIQPIFDANCIRCHNQREENQYHFAGIAKEKLAMQTGEKDIPAFSLLGETTVDEKAKRKWSDSYVVLTQRGRSNRVVNWIPVQSAPPMLAPYYKGAANSDLIKMLESGHMGVKISHAEIERIACWIDLLIPYCGSYTESNAWNTQEIEKYNHYQTKRERIAAEEEENIREMIGTLPGM